MFLSSMYLCIYVYACVCPRNCRALAPARSYFSYLLKRIQTGRHFAILGLKSISVVLSFQMGSWKKREKNHESVENHVNGSFLSETLLESAAKHGALGECGGCIFVRF